MITPSLAGRPITVLFLETSLRIGGTETMLAQLLERMDRRRFRPILCCFQEPGALMDRVKRSGVTVYERFAPKRASLSTLWKLWRLMRRERVEVVFMVNQPVIQFWGTVASLLAGVPVRVAAIRSTGKVNRVRRRLFINRLTFPLTTRVTSLSRTHQRYLIDEERIPEAKLEIVTNGVDLARFSTNGHDNPLRDRLSLPEGAPVVGLVAMLRPEKAHEVFVRAAAEVLTQVPQAKFLIVGEGPERAKIEAWIAQRDLGGSVLLLGARQDVPQLLQLCTVAVLCSWPVVETLSNAVLEYMACGKPVVATKVGSVPEQVDEGRTGFLVDPGDHRALADRIVRVLKSPARASAMGRAAREKVEREYSIERMVDQTQDLFERLLHESKPGRQQAARA